VEGVLAIRIAGLGDANRINQVYNVKLMIPAITWLTPPIRASLA